MTQTKKENISRGRPKKGFDLVQKKIETNTPETTSRGRPKKVRKIDDSINTKIDTKKKEISKLEKENQDISSKIGNSQNFSAKKIENSNGNVHEIEFYNDKKANGFSLFVLICSMLFFIFAIYKRFFYDTSMIKEAEQSLNDITIQELTEEGINNDEGNEFMSSGGGTTKDINNDEGAIDNIILNEETTQSTEEGSTITDEIQTERSNEDKNLLSNFYSFVNNLDFENINSHVDKYLRSSDVFRTYFSQNWLTNFINKIDSNSLSISNISLTSGDENTTRHYNYTLSYNIGGEQYEEQRETAIVNRNGQRLIGSLRCITTGCSKMPFFQK